MLKNYKKIIMYICLFSIMFFTTACTANKMPLESDTDIYDTKETGSFKKGGFMYSDYWVALECPYAGHPSGSIDSLWSTYYEDETGESVNVDFFGMEGDLENHIEELAVGGNEVTKGILWDNECYFYTGDSIDALISLGKNNYLQITFKREDGNLIEISSIPDTFYLKLTKVYVDEEEEDTSKIGEVFGENEDVTTIFTNFLAGDRNYLEKKQEEIWYIPDFLNDTLQYEYVFLDLDEDNEVELLIQMVDDPCGYNGVFHVEDGKIYCWNSDSTDMQCRDYPLRDGTMVRQYDYAGTRSYHIFWYDSDGEVHWYSKLFAREELIPEDSTEPCPYYEIDGMEISVDEFELNLKVLVTEYLLERDAWKEI